MGGLSMALGDSPFTDVMNDLSTVISDQGYVITVYQAVNCPCGSSPGSPSNINCAACGGLGILYPNAPITLTAMISDAEQQTDMNAQGYGLMEPGDLFLYPDPNAPRFNTFDLVMFPVSVSFPTHSETITRASGATDVTDYNIATVNGAWTVNSSTGVATAYTPGTDFTWTGKTITWNGNQPSADTMYSLRYGAQFEWVAFDPPTPRLAFNQDLGQIVKLRKRHIVFPGLPSPIGA